MKNILMTDDLRNSIVEIMLTFKTFEGSIVRIEDWISTRGNNFDRHCTRFGVFSIDLVHFGVRTSGSIATFRGKNQELEFRSDSIRSIEIIEEDVILEISLSENVLRRLRIRRMT